MTLFDNQYKASDVYESERAMRLVQCLKLFLVFNALYIIIVGIAVGEKSNGEPLVYFAVNGGLFLVKVVIVRIMIFGLMKNKPLTNYFIIASALAGLVYVILNFTPGREYRYLGLTGFQYAVHALNLVFASAVIFLAVMALKEMKAIRSAAQKPA